MKNIAEQYEMLSKMMATPEEFVAVQPMQGPVNPKYTIPMEIRYNQFGIVTKSIFAVPADAFVNTVNCVGVMGAGIALEFKKRYPKMFEEYKMQCDNHLIKPGDCYTYFDAEHHIYILNLAVKNDWRHWSTLEWLEYSIKSLKLTILENEIKSVNLPLLGGKNGRRGPFGKVPGFTPPPEKSELIELIRRHLEPFALKFKVDINLCIPEDAPKKEEFTLSQFFTV